MLDHGVWRLLTTYAVTDPELFRRAVWIHDITVNVSLALPFALSITKISPGRSRFLPFATPFSESIEWLLLVSADIQASVDKPIVHK